MEEGAITLMKKIREALLTHLLRKMSEREDVTDEETLN